MVFRLSFILLVFANLLLLAWSQGYLGGADSGREPQRLARQLRADQLRIVRDVSAPPALPTCALIEQLPSAAFDALEKTVADAGGRSRRLPPSLHRLLIPDLVNQAAAEKKLAELRRLKITEGEIVALPDGRREIVLASFVAEAEAQAAVTALGKQGVRSLRWEKPAPPTALEITAPAAMLSDKLKAWLAPYPAAKVGQCSP